MHYLWIQSLKLQKDICISMMKTQKRYYKYQQKRKNIYIKQISNNCAQSQLYFDNCECKKTAWS